MSRFIEGNSEIPRNNDATPQSGTASLASVSVPSSLPIAACRQSARSENSVGRPGGSMGNSSNTQRAYSSDWKHFSAWCRRQDVPLFPPDANAVHRYITACASGTATKRPNGVATVERRLSSLAWNYQQRGLHLERANPQIISALASIRARPYQAKIEKESVGSEDIAAMVETLDRSTLRGLRDRAILLLGFAGGLRRSEIVGLDIGANESVDGLGWIEFRHDSLDIVLNRRTGLHSVAIPQARSEGTCPVAALRTWLRLAKIHRGPVFRRVTGQGRAVGPQRLNAQEVARLVKRVALASGIGGDPSDPRQALRFSAQSLRRQDGNHA